jgi:nitrate/nitrite-specific signal transduction histidine kinase
VDSFWRLHELTYDGYTANSGGIRDALAREHHDCIAETVTRMHINLETFFLDQLGNESVLSEIADPQESQEVLKDLRQVLSDLRRLA